jgi:hypothetical protein
MRAHLAVIAVFGLWAAPANAQPCCGPITPAGERLSHFLDQSGVAQRWLSGWHVDWRTGEKDRAEPGGSGASTHCSSFVAAVADRLGVYLLRPPEYRQDLLANAQVRWLNEQGRKLGWRELTSYVEAQAAANRGELVLEAVENPNPHKPGHIAIIRPSEKTRAQLDREGPQETQAGTQNAVSISTAEGFRHHRDAWRRDGEGTLRYYAHTLP